MTSLHGMPLGLHPVSFRGQPSSAGQHRFWFELSCFGAVYVRESSRLAQLQKVPARCYLQPLQTPRPFANIAGFSYSAAAPCWWLRANVQGIPKLDCIRQDVTDLTAMQLSASLLQMRLLSYSTPLQLHECCFMIVRLGNRRGSQSRQLSHFMQSRVKLDAPPACVHINAVLEEFIECRKQGLLHSCLCSLAHQQADQVRHWLQPMPVEAFS